MVRIIGRFEKSGIELQCLTGRGTVNSFGSNQREVRETEGFRNRDSTVIDRRERAAT